MNRMIKIAMLAGLAAGVPHYEMPAVMSAPPRTNRPSGAARIKRQAKRLHNIRKRLPK